MARYRDKQLTIRLTEDELNTIKTRMKLGIYKDNAGKDGNTSAREH